jgi:hypothetical protein
MIVTVISACFIGSQQLRRRMIAFWGFISSNTLRVTWGRHANAYTLILLEFVLLGINVRGLRKILMVTELPDAWRHKYGLVPESA